MDEQGVRIKGKGIPGWIADIPEAGGTRFWNTGGDGTLSPHADCSFVLV